MDAIYIYIYAHVRFNDLDLGAKSRWVGKGKNSALKALDNNMTHETCYNGRPFLPDLDLDFANVKWLYHLL